MDKARKIVSRGFAKLLTFSGRDSRRQFWIYTGSVFLLTVLFYVLLMIPTYLRVFRAIQNEAKPALDLENMVEGFVLKFTLTLVLLILLLAAAVSRRLHDREIKGYWGLLPLSFMSFGVAAMSYLLLERPPNGDGVFALGLIVFFNNLAYLACLLVLGVWLAREGTEGANRYGPDPLSPERGSDSAGSR